MNAQNRNQKPDDSTSKTVLLGQDIVNAGIFAEVLRNQEISEQTTSVTIVQPNSFESIKADIIRNLNSKFPLFVVDNEVLGEPTLKGTRMPISDLLTAISVYANFDDVREEFDGRYSDEQLKEAIKYARDFLDSVFAS